MKLARRPSQMPRQPATWSTPSPPAASLVTTVIFDGYILSDDGSSCVEVAKFDAVLTIREAYDALVDSETCGSGATSNTVKHADVALTGVVTALRSMGFYVQDTTGGIFVSCKDKTCLKYADDTNVAIGDNVKVTSNGVGHYYCDLQVQALKDSSVSIEKLAPAQTVEPTTALIEDIAQDGAKNLNLGKLVVLSGLEAVSLDAAMNVGKSYGITGIGVYAYNEVRLAPRMREDIVEECAEGTYLCNPETNEYQHCYWGQWMEAKPCSGFNFTAADGSNVYATEFACNAANDGCIITACAEGYQPTANSLACESEVVPPTCTDGKMQCSGANDIQTCTDGSWAAAVSCASTITHATTAICETTGDTAVCKVTDCDEGFMPNDDGLSCVTAPEPCGEGDDKRCNPETNEYQRRTNTNNAGLGFGQTLNPAANSHLRQFPTPRNLRAMKRMTAASSRNATRDTCQARTV